MLQCTEHDSFFLTPSPKRTDSRYPHSMKYCLCSQGKQSLEYEPWSRGTGDFSATFWYCHTFNLLGIYGLCQYTGLTVDTKCLIFSKFTTTPLALFVSSSCGSSIILPISWIGELCCTEIPGKCSRVCSALWLPPAVPVWWGTCAPRWFCVLTSNLLLPLVFKVWLPQGEHFQRWPFPPVGQKQEEAPPFSSQCIWPQWWTLRLSTSFQEYFQVSFTVAKSWLTL